MQGISNYLKDHHPRYRQPTMRKLYEKIRALKETPHIGRPGRIKGTREIQPIGARFLRPFKPVEISFGRPIDLRAHYAERLDDPLVLRQATDEIMWEIRQLSGQQYVDRYASRSAQAAEDARMAAAGSAGASGNGVAPGGSPDADAVSGPGDGRLAGAILPAGASSEA